MYIGNLAGWLPRCQVLHPVREGQQKPQKQKQDGSEKIDKKVEHRRPLGIYGGSACGQKGRKAGSYVLTIKILCRISTRPLFAKAWRIPTEAVED